MEKLGYRLEKGTVDLGWGSFNARHRQHVIYTSVSTSTVVIGDWFVL